MLRLVPVMTTIIVPDSAVGLRSKEHMKTSNHQAVDVRYDRSDHGQFECFEDVSCLIEEGEAEEKREYKRL